MRNVKILKQISEVVFDFKLLFFSQLNLEIKIIEKSSLVISKLC